MLGEVAQVQRAVEAMERTLDNRNPGDSDLTHKRHSAEAGKRLAKALEASRKKTTEVLNQHMAGLRGQLEDATGLKGENSPQDTIARGEIRQVVRGMDPSERAAVLRRAVEDRDTDTLSALMLASPLLTGLDKELVARMRESYERQVAPEVKDELDALLEADCAAQSALRAADKAAQEVQNEEFLAQAQAAKDAQDGFSAEIEAIGSGGA
jgi:hypothetical protein